MSAPPGVLASPDATPPAPPARLRILVCDDSTVIRAALARMLEAEPGLHVVARLPFWTVRPEGAPAVQALVVSAAPPDPSGQDRSLLAVPADLDAAALGGAGLEGALPLGRAGGQMLLDVAGFVAGNDPRLAALPAGTRVIGAYAVPVGAA